MTGLSAALQPIFDRAVAAQAANDLPTAEQALRLVLSDHPSHAPSLHRLGAIAAAVGQAEPALALQVQAIEADPEFGDAWIAVAFCCRELGREAPARRAAETAVRLAPDDARAWSVFAVTCLDPEEKRQALEKVLMLPGADANSLYQVGLGFWELRDPVGEERAYRATLMQQPSHVHAARNLSMLLLAAGRWEEAWPVYAARDVTFPHMPTPRWTAGNLQPGTRLLVLSEQGFGDALQMLRYGRVLAERGVVVVWQCRPALQRLIAAQKWIAETVLVDAELPEHDLHVPMADLPWRMGTVPDGIPFRHGYLDALSGPVLPDTGTRRRVGLIWRSNSGNDDSETKSLPDGDLAPLLELSDVQFVSIVPGMTVPSGVMDGGALVSDFADTAALMAQLDDVVSIDSGPAHLAGALGVSGHIVLGDRPDWRWLAGTYSEGSPWYGSLKPHRRSPNQSWRSVLTALAKEL